MQKHNILCNVFAQVQCFHQQMWFTVVRSAQRYTEAYCNDCDSVRSIIRTQHRRLAPRQVIKPGS